MLNRTGPPQRGSSAGITAQVPRRSGQPQEGTVSLSMTRARVVVLALALILSVLAFAPVANASTSALFDLGAPVDAGVYGYLNGGVAQRPTETWEHSNYWVTPYGEPLETPPPPPPPASVGPWALFNASTPIANAASDDAERVEVGVRFSV